MTTLLENLLQHTVQNSDLAPFVHIVYKTRLSKREQYILSQRFEHDHTYTEIAELLSAFEGVKKLLSKERIRQLLERTLDKVEVFTLEEYLQKTGYWYDLDKNRDKRFVYRKNPFIQKIKEKYIKKGLIS